MNKKEMLEKFASRLREMSPEELAESLRKSGINVLAVNSDRLGSVKFKEDFYYEIKVKTIDVIEGISQEDYNTFELEAEWVA